MRRIVLAPLESAPSARCAGLATRANGGQLDEDIKPTPPCGSPQTCLEKDTDRPRCRCVWAPSTAGPIREGDEITQRRLPLRHPGPLVPAIRLLRRGVVCGPTGRQPHISKFMRGRLPMNLLHDSQVWSEAGSNSLQTQLATLSWLINRSCWRLWAPGSLAKSGRLEGIARAHLKVSNLIIS